MFHFIFPMVVSSITTRMRSQAMLIQFPTWAPLSAPVASQHHHHSSFAKTQLLVAIPLFSQNKLAKLRNYFTTGSVLEIPLRLEKKLIFLIGNLPLLDPCPLPLHPLQSGQPPPPVPAAPPAIIIPMQHNCYHYFDQFNSRSRVIQTYTVQMVYVYV